MVNAGSFIPTEVFFLRGKNETKFKQQSKAMSEFFFIIFRINNINSTAQTHSHTQITLLENV